MGNLFGSSNNNSEKKHNIPSVNPPENTTNQAVESNGYEQEAGGKTKKQKTKKTKKSKCKGKKK
jgi:hypothetical protein